MITIKLNYSGRKTIIDIDFESQLAATTFKNVAKLLGLKIGWEKTTKKNRVCIVPTNVDVRDYKDPYMKKHTEVKDYS